MKYPTPALALFTLSPAFAGSESSPSFVPGACAPGFMLTPAPQANAIHADAPG
ncbi:MAG: hypothetical protein QOH70_3249 [Blastocatellia bacterium]|jgi:hypothetical protein|nr:hypothetical protein [Blastocatellia bacterium]